MMLMLYVISRQMLGQKCTKTPTYLTELTCYVLGLYFHPRVLRVTCSLKKAPVQASCALRSDGIGTPSLTVVLVQGPGIMSLSPISTRLTTTHAGKVVEVEFVKDPDKS